MLPDRFWFYAALVQVTRKSAPVFCRRCHRVIQVMGDLQACGPHYCSPACQETARHTYRQTMQPSAPTHDVAPFVPSTYPHPVSFVCWPSEVRLDALDIMSASLQDMTTTAEAQQVIPFIRALLDEYRAVMLRVVVLDGFLYQPSAIESRVARLFVYDPERTDQRWTDQLSAIAARIATDTTLDADRRADLMALGSAVREGFLRMHAASCAFEQQCDPDQRPYATYVLATLLCQLETMIRADHGWERR